MARQALAAIGQAELMRIYQKFFDEYHQMVAQVLLTPEGLEDETDLLISYRRHFAVREPADVHPVQQVPAVLEGVQQTDNIQQCRFPGAGYTGNANKASQREFYINMFKVILRCISDNYFFTKTGSSIKGYWDTFST